MIGAFSFRHRMPLLLALVCSLAPVHAHWELVWADEFEVEGRPDPSSWTFEEGFVRNHELQWYQPDNAFCEDGKLVIEGRREGQLNPHYNEQSKDWRQRRALARYTSASVTTKGLHAWQYGRFEVRAKIIGQDGLWPAIWFLGVEGPWPSNGEIDLMEFYDGSILANACWEQAQPWKPQWDASQTPLAQLGADWDRDFHVWRMDWNADQIQLYVDDRLLNVIDLSETFNQAGRGPANPFWQPHYLLLNLAIGGRSGGDPTATEFPSRYEIDYVRVYQQRP